MAKNDRSLYFNNTVKGITASRDTIQKYVDEQRKKNHVDPRKLAYLLSMRRQSMQPEEEMPVTQEQPPADGVRWSYPSEQPQDPIQAWITSRKVTGALAGANRPQTAQDIETPLEAPPQGFQTVTRPAGDIPEYQRLPAEERAKFEDEKPKLFSKELGLKGSVEQIGQNVPQLKPLTTLAGMAIPETKNFREMTAGGKALSLAEDVAFSVPWGAVLSQTTRQLVKQGVKQVASDTFTKALNTGLDKWIATQGRLTPEARSAFGNLLVKDRTWLVERATDNMLARMGRTKNVSQAVNEAVEATIRDVETALIPRGTQTGAMKFGGLMKGGGEVPRQPWQMTQQEWNDGTRFYYSGKTKMAQTPSGERIIFKPEATPNTFRDNNAEFLKSVRSNDVAKALAEGKPVPQNVLADYPDLQKTVKAPALSPSTSAQTGIEKINKQNYNTGMKESWQMSLKEISDKAEGHANRNTPIKTIGYRYGNAPESGYSWNYRENISEKGVSLASANGLPESHLFATLEAKSNRNKSYYIGELIGYGGDDEPLIRNAKKITYGEYKKLLNNPEIQNSKLAILADDYLTADNLAAKGYTGYGDKSIRRLEILKQEHKKIIQKALSEGKPVPPEVLKDYPDLQGMVKTPDLSPSTSVQTGKTKEQNFTQFAESKGLPSDYDITDHSALSPSGHVSNRAKTASIKSLEQRITDNRLAHEEYRKAILSGEIIDPSGEVTKAGLEAEQASRTAKDIASQRQIIQGHIKDIESYGKMSHKENGQLKIGYQRMVDDYKAQLKALDSPSQPSAIAKEATIPAKASESIPPTKPLTEVETTQTPLTKAEAVSPPVKPPEVPPESPSAIVQQVITPPAQASVPPAGTPPTTPPIQTAPVTPRPQGARFTMADLQNTDDVISAIEKPDVWRKVSNTPVIKEFMAKFNPSAVANTPEAKYLVGRQVLFDEADQKTAGIMSNVLQKGRQADVFGKAGNNQVIQSGALKGNTVGDIVSNPGKYNLTPAQKQWVEAAQDIEKAKLEFARRNGIDIQELTFEDGGQYASRKIYARVDKSGQLMGTAQVGSGASKPGKLTSMEKSRVFKTEADAIKAGYYPLPYEEALSLNVKGIMRRVADQKMSEWLLSKIDYRTTGAPQELIEDSFIAKRKLDQSRRLLAALNRAVRGERVPASTLNSLNNSFPQQANDLKKIIDGVQNKTDVKAQIKALRTASKGMADTYYKDWLKTQGLKARARERALGVGMGEASVPAPAFQGKIFTGENAREIADTIIRGLDPRLNEALHAVNKVNAISRYFSLAGDISVGGIQLIMLPGQNPVIHAKALAGMVRGIVDPRFIQRYLAENKTIIDKSPNLIIPTEGATEFTEAMAKGGALGGSSPITGLPGESPAKSAALAAPRLVSKVGKTVLEPFQRGMEDALTVAGIELKKAYMYTAKTPQQMTELDQWINEFRGLTNSRRLGVSPNMRGVETAFTLAPQYNRAIAGLLFDLTRGTIRGHRARISLMRGIGALTAMGIAVSYALGERDPEEIAKHFVPGSSDFFTWEILGQKVGPGSKVRSVINLIGQSAKNPGDLLKNSMENPTIRFMRGNLSPGASTSLDILTGRNYLGEPTRDSIGQLTRALFWENLTPIWTQSVLMEKSDSLEGTLLRGGIEFAGGRAYPEPLWSQASELANKYAQADYNKSKDKLNSLEYKDLLRNHPDLQDIYTRADIDSAYKGDPFQEFLDTFGDEQKQIRDNGLDRQAVALRNGFISRSEYDKERAKLRAYFSGASTAVYEAKQNYNPSIYKLFEAKQQPEDKNLSEYLDYQAKLFAESPIPINYEQIKYDLANYIKQYDTKTQKYIQDHETDWIKDLPENAKFVETARVSGLQDESWFDDYYEVLFERPSSGTTTSSGTPATTPQPAPTTTATTAPATTDRSGLREKLQQIRR